MLLRETMWEIFLSTGNIDAYLAYRDCLNCDTSQPKSLENAAEPLSTLLLNNIGREVRWQ